MLQEYANSLDMESSPVLTSIALVNSAKMVNRLCLNPKTHNYSIPHPLFGNEDCPHKHITENFVPKLSTKAKV